MNWKVTSFLIVAIISITTLYIWNDYKKFRDEARIKITADHAKTKVVYKTNTKYAASLQKEIRDLKSKLRSSTKKTKEAIKQNAILKVSLENHEKLLSNLRTKNCVAADWDKQEFYAYKGKDLLSLTCYFDLRTRTVRKMAVKFSDYVKERLP